MMPGMDGLTLCRAFHEEPKLRMVPVILLTAKVSQEAIIEGLEAGAVDYITKPFSFNVLLAKIRGLLKREAEQEELALRDGLTGLLTRAAWEQEAKRELSRISRTGGGAIGRPDPAALPREADRRRQDAHAHRARGEVRRRDVRGEEEGEELRGPCARRETGSLIGAASQARFGLIACSMDSSYFDCAKSQSLISLLEYAGTQER